MALASATGTDAAIALATGRINDRQVGRIAEPVQDCDKPGAIVAVLGLAYKIDTDVIEYSQGVSLAALPARRGYQIILSDPLARDSARAVLPADIAIADAQSAVMSASVVVIVTSWPEYRGLDPGAFGYTGVIIDPWRILAPTAQCAQIIYPGRSREEPQAPEGRQVRAAGGRTSATVSALEAMDR